MRLGRVQQLNRGSFSLQVPLDRRTLGSPVSISEWKLGHTLEPNSGEHCHISHMSCVLERSSMDIIFSQRDILNWTPPLPSSGTEVSWMKLNPIVLFFSFCSTKFSVQRVWGVALQQGPGLQPWGAIRSRRTRGEGWRAFQPCVCREYADTA